MSDVNVGLEVQNTSLLYSYLCESVCVLFVSIQSVGMCVFGGWLNWPHLAQLVWAR